MLMEPLLAYYCVCGPNATGCCADLMRLYPSSGSNLSRSCTWDMGPLRMAETLPGPSQVADQTDRSSKLSPRP